MGFVINDEQKIRISLSLHAFLIIQDDMQVFEVPKLTSFINTVISNFRDGAKASLQKYLANKRLDLEELFKDSHLPQDQIEDSISHLLKKEEARIKKELQEFQKEHYIRKSYHINKDNIDYLMNDCVDHKLYLDRPGRYLKCILEEYASCPFVIRERIFKKDIYTIVERACMSGTLLSVNKLIAGEVQTLHVYPYKIVPDPLNTQEYLICYSKKQHEPSKDKKMASFAMSRLDSIKELKHSAFISEKDKNELDTTLTRQSAAFLTGDTTTIRIRFTEEGKVMYRHRLQSRPDITRITDSDIYEFTCTEYQAYNYFFTFGSTIEVLSPTSLREKMMAHYKQAFSVYQ